MQSRSWYSIGVVLTLATLVFATGCGGGSTPDDETDGEGAHAHEHGVGEKLGPNGGHLLTFADIPETPTCPYTAEWLHDDDTETITVFILDGEGENEVALPIDHVVIEVMYTGLDTDEYELLAVVEEGEEPAAENAQFQITEPQLMTALNMKANVINSLKIEVDGNTYMAHIEHHDHGHGHSHD